MNSIWGVSPRQSILAECDRRGRPEVVQGCIAILVDGVTDATLLYVLAGPAAGPVLDGRSGGVHGHWPRVWALRAFLYAWSDEATEVVVRSLGDEAWRAREMAAKVVARQRVDEAFDVVCALRDDPVERVRTAADRAVQRLAASQR